MEIPVVAEALRIPGLAARLLSDLAGAWTSVALLVAGLAAFYGFLLARAKLALLRFRRSASAISLHSNFSFSGDDDEDDVESSESPSDEDEEEDDPPSSLFDDSASGNSGVDWRWDGGFLDLPLGGAVVRTWEGLGLRFDRAGSGLISLVDLNRGEVLRSFLGQSVGRQGVRRADPRGLRRVADHPPTAVGGSFRRGGEDLHERRRRGCYGGGLEKGPVAASGGNVAGEEFTAFAPAQMNKLLNSFPRDDIAKNLINNLVRLAL
ncbi:hypothetical protein ZIOFF_029462 [Zingiber officinale]|uniref:Uncharacterized protein n=1 Tax=Zingiber officinale TaxID=94328 RepID=A0A8J5LAW3_ZINOF|nr:hypothetical protein ZIOFF_029462 [Zingiber officinale]